jgi:hypothetical protein
LLTEQRLDVGIVVDHKNQNAHVRPQFFFEVLLILGKTILNSVN